MILYHGTNSNFNKFSKNNIGKNTSVASVGFFFTDSIETAKTYGNNILNCEVDLGAYIECDFDGKSTYYFGEEKWYTPNDLAVRIDELNKDIANYVYSIGDMSREEAEEYMDYLGQDGGYGHLYDDKIDSIICKNIKDNMDFGGELSNNYIVFDENRIKILQQETLNEELNNNFWNWFGDSITVDDNGEPIVFYHGTRSDFVEFKSEYDDNLIFFAFDKKFADEWGRNKSYSNDIKDTIYNRAKPYRNSLYKSYQSRYGDDFYYNDEEAYKLYKDEINNYENELEKEYNVHSRTIPCYLKTHKIFMPEKHYELVLDEIMDYYGFPKEAIDHKKEIEELRKEKEILISNFKSSGRKLPTKEEEDELNTINDKISILYDEQNSIKDFENNHLPRIKKGAWIYFEHGIVIDKIWSLGFDAIQLSESNGQQTTMAVRANNNQIKAPSTTIATFTHPVCSLILCATFLANKTRPDRF